MPDTAAPLDCPFCGGPAEVTNPTKRGRYGGRGVKPTHISVGCQDPYCAGWLGVRGLTTTRDETVGQWNRRADRTAEFEAVLRKHRRRDQERCSCGWVAVVYLYSEIRDGEPDMTEQHEAHIAAMLAQTDRGSA